MISHMQIRVSSPTPRPMSAEDEHACTGMAWRRLFRFHTCNANTHIGHEHRRVLRIHITLPAAMHDTNAAAGSDDALPLLHFEGAHVARVVEPIHGPPLRGCKRVRTRSSRHFWFLVGCFLRHKPNGLTRCFQWDGGAWSGRRCGEAAC